MTGSCVAEAAHAAQKEQSGVPGSVETCDAVRLLVQQESVLAGDIGGAEFQDQGAACGREESSEDTLPGEGQQQKDQENTQNVAKPKCRWIALKHSKKFTPEP